MIPVGNVIDRTDEERNPNQPSQAPPLVEFIAPDVNSLLKTSLRYMSANPQSKEMNPLTMQWLTEALNEHIVNPMEKIKDCLNLLRKSLEPETASTVSASQVDAALEEICFHCEVIDFAQDLQRLGGLKFVTQVLLPHYLSSKKMQHALLAFDILIVCTQNNTITQDGVLNEMPDYIPSMLSLVMNAQDVLIRRKALSALSAVLSNNPHATKALLQNLDAVRGIVEVIQKTDELPIRRKVLFLLYTMLMNDMVLLPAELLKQGFIEVLANVMQQEPAISDIDVIEFSFHVANSLLQSTSKQQIGKEMQQRNFHALVANIKHFLQNEHRTPEEDEYMKIRPLIIEFEKLL